MSYTRTINIITLIALVALITTVVFIVIQDKDSNSRILLFHRRFMNNLRGKKDKEEKTLNPPTTKASEKPSSSQGTSLLYNDAIMY